LTIPLGCAIKIKNISLYFIAERRKLRPSRKIILLIERGKIEK